MAFNKLLNFTVFVYMDLLNTKKINKMLEEPFG